MINEYSSVECANLGYLTLLVMYSRFVACAIALICSVRMKNNKKKHEVIKNFDLLEKKNTLQNQLPQVSEEAVVLCFMLLGRIFHLFRYFHKKTLADKISAKLPHAKILSLASVRKICSKC